MTDEPGRLYPADYLLLAYLAATGLLAAVSSTSTGLLLAGAHVVVGLGVVELGRRPLPRGRILRFLRLAYPLALTPFLYSELQVLNQVLAVGYHDSTVQAWEAAIFGGQLSVVLPRSFSDPWLSELLHGGYLSYYLLIPGAALVVYLEAGERGLARYTGTVALAYFICYLCFTVFPVAGPRYEFPPISGPPSEGFLFGVVHQILEAGSAKGTAFPSSHVAASGAVLLGIGRDAPRWLWLFAPPVALLVVGTVYGRFHYAVDAVAGLGVAVLAWAALPWLERRLDGDFRGVRT